MEIEATSDYKYKTKRFRYMLIVNVKTIGVQSCI